MAGRVASAAVCDDAMAGRTRARGEDSRDHVFAWEKAGEGEGKEVRSPQRKSEAETARFVGLNTADCGGHRRRFSAQASSREREGVGSRRRNGRRAEARARVRRKRRGAGENVGEIGARLRQLWLCH